MLFVRPRQWASVFDKKGKGCGNRRQHHGCIKCIKTERIHFEYSCTIVLLYRDRTDGHHLHADDLHPQSSPGAFHIVIKLTSENHSMCRNFSTWVITTRISHFNPSTTPQGRFLDLFNTVEQPAIKSVATTRWTWVLREAYFLCFSQNRQPHARDQRPKTLWCSVLAPSTRRPGIQKVNTEHQRNAKTLADLVIYA